MTALQPALPLSPARFRSAHRTHQGLLRQTNEDALMVSLSQNLWAVADGMGGHAHGDEASSTVVDALAGITFSPSSLPDQCINQTEDALIHVNKRLRARALRLGVPVMGSTVAIVVAYRSLITAAWIGDSRVYRYGGGRLWQMTHDHVSPDGRLTRALGAHERCWLDVSVCHLGKRDRLLLCTDGLYRDVPEAVITQLLAAQNTVSQCADLLLQAALSGGGRDNVSVIVVEAQ